GSRVGDCRAPAPRPRRPDSKGGGLGAARGGKDRHGAARALSPSERPVDSADDGALRDRAVLAVSASGAPERDPQWEVKRSSSRASLPLAGLFQERSEEHTSALQSRVDLVCRLLLE